MPMLSGWTDVFQVPGKRTTGTKAQKYAITGPNWTGTLPKSVTGGGGNLCHGGLQPPPHPEHAARPQP
jgi:hypothetical protein